MNDVSTAVEGIISNHADILFHGFSDAMRETCMESVRLWLTAWLETHGKSREAFEQLVSETIPQRLRDELNGLSQADRYILAASAFMRWRLQVLNKQVLDRAKAFHDSKGKLDEYKDGAKRDLDELKRIEAALAKDFPDVLSAYKTIISECKLDCLFVQRDGAISSLRMSRRIMAKKVSSTDD